MKPPTMFSCNFLTYFVVSYNSCTIPPSIICLHYLITMSTMTCITMFQTYKWSMFWTKQVQKSITCKCGWIQIKLNCQVSVNHYIIAMIMGKRSDHGKKDQVHFAVFPCSCVVNCWCSVDGYCLWGMIIHMFLIQCDFL